MRMTFLLPLLTLLAACGLDETKPEMPDTPEHMAELMVAGGCFWCVEADLEKLHGVQDVISGYGGGSLPDPTYRTYSRGGHREVALVHYDPATISFEELMSVFIRTIDVSDDGGQFCDRGYGYTTAVYYATEEERETLERVIAEGEEELGRSIVTPIEEKPTFYAAEVYHQNYYMKKPRQYAVYRGLCGRDQTVRSLWGQAAGELVAARKKM